MRVRFVASAHDNRYQPVIKVECPLLRPAPLLRPPFCALDVVGLVLDLDAAYSDTSLVSPDQADEPQELTYVDIDTFLASF